MGASRKSTVATVGVLRSKTMLSFVVTPAPTLTLTASGVTQVATEVVVTELQAAAKPSARNCAAPGAIGPKLNELVGGVAGSVQTQVRAPPVVVAEKRMHLTALGTD